MTPRYHYCSQQMPALGVWVLVWFSTEDVEATWTGARWVDRQGRLVPDVMCWREQ